MTPKETLEYMAKMGQDLERNSKTALAMLAEAEERGIPVDLSSNERVQKFAALGEYEKQLIKLKSELGWVSTDILRQGVKMTAEELEARLQKMEESE